jgi:hypothetical protein
MDDKVFVQWFRRQIFDLIGDGDLTSNRHRVRFASERAVALHHGIQIN